MFHLQVILKQVSACQECVYKLESSKIGIHNNFLITTHNDDSDQVHVRLITTEYRLYTARLYCASFNIL